MAAPPTKGWKNLKADIARRSDAQSLNLGNGRLFMVGGTRDVDGDDQNQAVGYAEIFESKLGRSYRMHDMLKKRTGCAITSLNGFIYVAGGYNPDTGVLVSIERYAFESGWKLSGALPTPRWHASCVSLPEQNVLLLIGGRGALWEELASIDVCRVKLDDERKMEWLEPLQMPKPRFAPAAILLSSSLLLVIGGFDGHEWKSSSCLYDFPLEDIETGKWKKDFPRMPKPVAFPQVSRLGNYLYVVGESISSNEKAVIQCFDIKARKWTLVSTSAPKFDAIVAHGSHMYGVISKKASGSDLGAYSRRLDALGKDSTVSAASSFVSLDADFDLPVAAMAEANNASRKSIATETFDYSVGLRSVEDLALPDGMSRYTGQMRKVGASWLPHGQGLEIWTDKEKQYYPLSHRRNSYFRGRYVDGYRDGDGEMFLEPEGQRYIGQFVKGSWEGFGMLEIPNNGIKYFGSFSAGQRAGEGSCEYRFGRENRYYHGGWKNGRAHGNGTVTDLSTGVVIEHRIFEQEDILAG